MGTKIAETWGFIFRREEQSMPGVGGSGGEHSAVTAGVANPFIGAWRGNTSLNGMPLIVSLALGADYQYSQQLVSGPYMTRESGLYVLRAPNLISFEVHDWAPRTLPVAQPGSFGVTCFSPAPTPRPANSTFRYQFMSAASVCLDDTINVGARIVMARLQ
jgi:hypothetical protein